MADDIHEAAAKPVGRKSELVLIRAPDNTLHRYRVAWHPAIGRYRVLALDEHWPGSRYREVHPADVPIPTAKEIARTAIANAEKVTP